MSRYFRVESEAVMIDGTIKTPFTPEQVEQLNRFQSLGNVHPFTCGNNSRHRDLVATESGWKCLDCDYTQQWAHGHMDNKDFIDHMERGPSLVLKRCHGPRPETRH